MLVLPTLAIPLRKTRWATTVGWATVTSDDLREQYQSLISASEPTSLSSLRSLAAAVTVDREEFDALRRHPRRPVISLDLGIQTSPHEVPAANPLPRRRGPKLPVVTVPQDGMIVAGR
jgi:hypothetical protein